MQSKKIRNKSKKIHTDHGEPDRSLSEYQRKFSDLLFHDYTPENIKIPGIAASAENITRISVYRNNVISGQIKAMRTLYPAFFSAIGNEYFDTLATAYLCDIPMKEPYFHLIGEKFPHYLSRLEHSEIPVCLNELATLENLLNKAYHSPDETIMSLEGIRKLDPEAVYSCRVKFHPSCDIIRARTPVYQIWSNISKDKHYDENIDLNVGQNILLFRNLDDVCVHFVSDEVFHFLYNVFKNLTIGRALESVHRSFPKFDLSECTSFLFEARIIVELIE